MIGQTMKKLAEELGLSLAGDVAYGEYGGYVVTLSESAGDKSLRVSAALADDQVRGGLYMLLENKPLRKRHRIQRVSFTNQAITVQFTPGAHPVKQIGPFIRWFLPEMARNGAPGAGTCPFCGQPLAGESPVRRKVNDVVHALHGECASEIERQSRQERDAFAVEPGRYLRGACGALIGAALGAVPWAFIYMFGWFVGYLGLLIGFLAKKGYEMLGGKKGMAKFLIVLAATLLGVVAGNLGGVCLQIGKEILTGNLEGATLIDIPLILRYALTVDSEFMGSMLLDIGLGFVFALLGVIGILKEIRTEGKNAVTRVEELG